MRHETGIKRVFRGFFFICVLLSLTQRLTATEYFVAPVGNDSNHGTKNQPLRTIQRAAELASPGDVITVRAGVYRERINPPRGGVSDRKRIIYQAAKGERVEIKGSEIVTNWQKLQADIWVAALPNSFFGKFNPFTDLIHGDWFEPKGRAHHTGAVYLNGDWLVEAARLDEVLTNSVAPGSPMWFASVDASNTTVWAQFPGINPNQQLVEVNVRRTVFYPDQPGRNFLTVRGFIMSQAATPWAPPTAEQVGLIGTHWSKGWVIENNLISHSTCSGIALGKYGDQWDNTSANSAEGYVKTIERALSNGWNRESIGHHIVRNNTVSQCEQAGIVGSLGAAFCTVTGNTIRDIHVRRLLTGAEMAGIKFHGAIDTVISRNHIYRTCRGLWLDWMAQGTRVSANLFHENESEDVFVEVNHGPFLLDNNLFLSRVSLLDMSEGGAYAHNLFAGKLISRPEPSRQTPYHSAHSTVVAGLRDIQGGDDRFFNNIFLGPGPVLRQSEFEKDPEWRGGFGLWVYNFRAQPLQTGGNLFCNGARPYLGEKETSVLSQTTLANPKLVQKADALWLNATFGPEVNRTPSEQVTTFTLGKARAAQAGYENANGSPLRIDRDFFGKRRNSIHPTAGPFKNFETGELNLSLP